MFWSSVDLTGNQTEEAHGVPQSRFWSSVDLTGNQTLILICTPIIMFWSSVDLTGNQTRVADEQIRDLFWSSVDLTGNQTTYLPRPLLSPFWSIVDLTGNQTDGARAIVAVSKNRNGHVFITENSLGKIFFVDPQTNKRYSNVNLNKVCGAQVIRIDDQKFTKYARNAFSTQKV